MARFAPRRRTICATHVRSHVERPRSVHHDSCRLAQCAAQIDVIGLGNSALQQISRKRKKPLASPAPPIRKLVRDKIMSCRDIHHPHPRCEALCHDPGLHLVWPPPVPAPRLNNLTLTNKTSQTACHVRLSVCFDGLVAETTQARNAQNQWIRDVAYDYPAETPCFMAIPPALW